MPDQTPLIRKESMRVDQSKFKRSEYAENIHYADMFKINGRHWAILGHGKSRAAMVASNDDRAADLCRDSLAMFIQDGRLYGRFDPGMITDRDDDLFAHYPIDLVVYCISAETTVQVFGEKDREIVSCKPELLAAFSTQHFYPAWALTTVLDPEEHCRLNDPERRACNLLDLLQASPDVPTLLVPWMDSDVAKAELYRQYNGTGIKNLDHFIQKKS